MEPTQVSIKILDKEYRIACNARDQDDLRASAHLLDTRMRDIRQTGRVIGSDRMAVMAALNIAHELIKLQRSRPLANESADRRLYQLQERVSTALALVPTPTAEASEESPLDAPDEKV